MKLFVRFFQSGIFRRKRALKCDTGNAGIAFFFFIIAGWLLTFPPVVQALTADQLLIVSNRNVAASGSLARYYMEQRRVPQQNLLRLRTTDREQVSREDYEKQIAAPLRAFLREQDPDGSRFRCIVLMYGLPLRVLAPAATPAERVQSEKLQLRLDGLENRLAALGKGQESRRKALQEETAEVRHTIQQHRQFHKGAAVDSELALVAEENYPLQGWVPNRYFLGFRDLPRDQFLQKVLLVSRLDAPTPEVVRRMIDDSLVAEQAGLAGNIYLDARWPQPVALPSSAYRRYDAAIHNTARLLRKSVSLPVILDDKETLLQAGQAPEAALYNGWYSLGRYVDAFDWARGAVGYHVASGECTTLKKEGSRVWCKALLEDGVAATVGPVAEPYLQSFPSPEIFFGCLAEGRNQLAECYALANPFWSWQMVLLGDPLYRPFKQRGTQPRPQLSKVPTDHEL